jgi:large subunit ribosomal protein L24e
MVKCVFCGKEEHSFMGVHLIKNDGNIEFYCSSKCRKNATKLKRDKKKFKWTAAFHEQRARLADHLAKKEDEKKAEAVSGQDKPTKKAKKQ